MDLDTVCLPVCPSSNIVTVGFYIPVNKEVFMKYIVALY